MTAIFEPTIDVPPGTLTGGLWDQLASGHSHVGGSGQIIGREVLGPHDSFTVKRKPLSRPKFRIAASDNTAVSFDYKWTEFITNWNFGYDVVNAYSYSRILPDEEPEWLVRRDSHIGIEAETKTEPLHAYVNIFVEAPSIAVDRPRDLRKELTDVFALAAGEHFEDGIETEFSHAIGQFIGIYGIDAIDNFKIVIERNLFRDTYVAEALLWIGELDDEGTENARRLLLEAACGSDSVSVRDAAVSGLAYLGPDESQGRLERMLKEEHVRGVRANIEAVLAYIRD